MLTTENYYHVKEQAEIALKAGLFESAAGYASELLAQNVDENWWNYGNVIHEAHQLLGLAALQAGEVDTAKVHLLEAGRTPGSPQLISFGPSMVLAQALLMKGESEAVSAYLDEVAKFWCGTHTVGNRLFDFIGRRLAEKNTKQLAAWKEQIARGQKPQLNRVPQDLGQ